jgi:hypothetical protein
LPWLNCLIEAETEVWCHFPGCGSSKIELAVEGMVNTNNLTQLLLQIVYLPVTILMVTVEGIGGSIAGNCQQGPSQMGSPNPSDAGRLADKP